MSEVKKKKGKITIEDVSKTDVENLRRQGKLLEDEDLWTYLFWLTFIAKMKKGEGEHE